MMRFSHISLGALALAVASPAWANPVPAKNRPVIADPAATVTLADTDVAGGDGQTENSPPTPATPAEAPKPVKTITITGGATLVTDYRFRGLTQSDEKPVVQGTINLNHKSGFYIGTWASEIDGGLDGSTPALTGYGFAEVDLYAGFTRTLSSGVGFDLGVLYYYYPDGAKGINTDFFEPYASVNYTIGPVNAKLGGAYAWGGQDGLNFTAGNDDNIYVYGELSAGIPTTPFTLKGHLGYTSGSLGLVNPTFADDNYLDWSVTIEAVGGPAKFGVSYVDTDITEARLGTPRRRFAQSLGRGSGVLAYVGFSF